MRKLLAVLLAGSLFAGACSEGSDPSDDPKGALREAFERVNDDPVTITLSFEADQAELERALTSAPDPAPPGVASMILDSQLVLSGNGKQGDEAKAEFSLVVGGRPVAEIVAEGTDLYLRADVPGLLQLAQMDPNKVESRLRALPPGLGFLRDAAAGEWIHLTGLDQAAQMAEAQQGASDEEQARVERFLNGLIDEHVSASEGDDEGPGTHIEARLALRAFVQDFLVFARESAGGALPPQAMPPVDTADIPQGDLILDTWIEDGELTQLRLDLIENAQELGEEEPPEDLQEAAILVTLEDWDEHVDVPQGATQVSVQEIFGALMSLAFTMPQGGTEPGGSGTTPPATDINVCKEIAKLPAEQQQAFKELCPNL